MKQCRFLGCPTTKLHRFGLCNKHRKWVERGYMTEDLTILKKVERPVYSAVTCKITGCLVRPRRNGFCAEHAGKVKRGTINMDGAPSLKNGKISGRYPENTPCKVCKVTGVKIIRGFCPKHYSQLLKGHRDVSGMFTQKVCIASDCKRRLINKTRDWCYQHHISFLAGVYNSKGKRLKPRIVKNEGLLCRAKDCTAGAHCKGLCRLHYNRQRSGYLGPAGYKNVGKPCSEAGCDRPASCRTVCTKHYWILMHGVRKFINKGKKCKYKNARCKQRAYCKGLCVNHYNKQRPRVKIDLTRPPCVEGVTGSVDHQPPPALF